MPVSAGHFRHEVGHYDWDVRVCDGCRLEDAASCGDDSQDYGAALQAYHQTGPPADWQENFVSAYASAHPWEDWADLGALSAFRGHARDGQRVWVRVQPRVSRDETLAAEIGPDPYRTDGMQEIVDAWLPLTFAVDSLNRAMGNHDLDPFVFRLP